MLIDAVSVTTETETVLVDPPAAGYGATADFPTRPVGHFDYDLGVELIPAFNVKFFTFELVSLDLGEFAVQAAESSGNATFAPVTASLPIPDVRFLSTEIEFPDTMVGMTSTVQATVRNFGEAPLHLDFSALPAPFSVGPPTVVIEPGALARVPIVFTPTTGGEVMTVGMVSTNDPDSPIVLLDLSAVGTVPGMPDMACSKTAGRSRTTAAWSASTAGSSCCRTAPWWTRARRAASPVARAVAASRPIAARPPGCRSRSPSGSPSA